jgi:hypothetical protein
MASDWVETTDGGGFAILQRQAGAFWLAVSHDVSSGEWDAYVDMRSCTERVLPKRWRKEHRTTVFSLWGLPTREAAQEAAEKTLRELFAPFVVAAERERDVARAETEIPAACAAVRERTIGECTAKLKELFTQLNGRVRHEGQSDEDFYSRLGHATGVTLAINALRALAATELRALEAACADGAEDAREQFFNDAARVM